MDKFEKLVANLDKLAAMDESDCNLLNDQEDPFHSYYQYESCDAETEYGELYAETEELIWELLTKQCFSGISINHENWNKLKEHGYTPEVTDRDSFGPLVCCIYHNETNRGFSFG